MNSIVRMWIANAKRCPTQYRIEWDRIRSKNSLQMNRGTSESKTKITIFTLNQIENQILFAVAKGELIDGGMFNGNQSGTMSHLPPVNRKKFFFWLAGWLINHILNVSINSATVKSIYIHFLFLSLSLPRSICAVNACASRHEAKSNRNGSVTTSEHIN